MRKITSTFSFLVFFVSGIQAQLTSTYSAQVANHYFGFSLKLIRETPGFTPPVASRALGFSGLTLYEAMVPGMPSRLSTEGTLLGLTSVTHASPTAIFHWPTVANNALALILDSLFANAITLNKDSLHAIKDGYNTIFQGQVSAQIFNDSKYSNI